jgi:hypothetical protein
MKTEIKLEMAIETTAYMHNGTLKTRPCDLSDWWGGEICKELDFNSEIENYSLPEGEYKIKIILEKVN